MARPRRAAWTDSRASILEAAQDLFARRGYRGTTTRELAAAAGVAEPTLFRHFSSKADLFDEAVVTPVGAFLRQFVDRRKERPPGSRDEVTATREFYAELYDELVRDAPLLVALVAALTFEEPDAELSAKLRPALRHLLTGLDDHFAREFSERGYEVDPHVGLRMMVGMAIGLAVHGDWLFADDEQVPRERLVEHMTQLTIWGLAGQPRA